MAAGSLQRQRAVMLAIRIIAIVVFAVLSIGVVGVLLDRLFLSALAVFIAIVMFVRWRRARPAAVEAKELQRLVRLCHGDRMMALRLVANEERRSPEIARLLLVRRAIDRLVDDRRR
jgi:hypothetical protein